MSKITRQELASVLVTDLDSRATAAALATHANLTTTAHGAVPAPTANTIILRDASGRAQVAAPSVAADIARLDTVTTHTALTNTAHGAVSAPTINTLMARDAAGRAQVAAPAVEADIARLDTVTTHAAQSAAGTHGSAVTAAPNTLIHRDANGRAQIAAPSAAADIARLDTITAHTLDNTVHGMHVHTGNFVATAGIVPGGVHTHTVPLGASDFKRVAARFIHVAHQLGAFVYAGRTVASAVSMLVANSAQHCKSRAVHSELGANSIHFLNSIISGVDGITLEHVYINGSDLEFRWRNVGSVINTLNIRVEWEVYK